MRSDQIVVFVKAVMASKEFNPSLGQLQVVRFIGVAKETDVSFDITSGPLRKVEVQPYLAVQKHGFSVVEIPRDWSVRFTSTADWVNHVVQEAVKRVGQSLSTDDNLIDSQEYDESFAEEVLRQLSKAFPNGMDMAALKCCFDPEPRSAKLAIALQGLTAYGYVSGFTPRHSTSPLAHYDMARITAIGREKAMSNGQSSNRTIIHGGQFNNYGNAGAMGPYSSGTFNYKTAWAELEKNISLPIIVDELRFAVEKLANTAETSTNREHLDIFTKAEEEAAEGKGAEMLKTLSRMGSALMPTLLQLGVRGLAHYLAPHAMHWTDAHTAVGNLEHM